MMKKWVKNDIITGVSESEQRVLLSASLDRRIIQQVSGDSDTLPI